MGLSVMADAPDWEQSIRYANNVGAASHIGKEHWLGESNMNQLGFVDTNVAGMGDGGQIASAITQGISTIGQTIAQIQASKQASKQAGKSKAPPKQKNSPEPMSMHEGGGGGGGGEWISGIPNWGVVAGGALVMFLLVFAMSKKSKGSPAPVSSNPWF